MKKSKEGNMDGYLERLDPLLRPFIGLNEEVNLGMLEEPSLMAYLMAVILNTFFLEGGENSLGGFGADDVIPVRIKVENKTIHYWGKISWIYKPEEHQCYQSYLDPFYGRFEFTENGLEVKEILFASQSKIVMSLDSWTQDEIDWMYEIR